MQQDVDNDREGGTRQFSCTKCKRVYGHLSSMRRHEKICKECPHCKVFFKGSKKNTCERSTLTS